MTNPGNPPPRKQLDILRHGVVEITTEEELLRKIEQSEQTGKPLRVKLGVDPTSTDIHLGHTVVLRKLRRFQDLGHKAVLIIGDYTALIGDPSGQNKTRPTLTEDQVKANARTYFEQVSAILDVDAAEIVYNGQWFSKLTFRELIDLASKVTVARIMERDDFAKRWAAHQQISVHELLYPIMQGYDSIMVGADVELGGTDQTFNLLMGRQMQRSSGSAPQVTITMPILVGLDGTQKMSKSKGNYIGVTEPPADMYGKVMSIPDTLMENYFELLTPIPETEYREMLATGHPRDTKAALALAIVTEFWGRPAAVEAAARFDRVFRDHKLPTDLPEITLGAADLQESRISLVRLITTAGFAPSNSEARRLVRQGAVTLDGKRLDDPNQDVQVAQGQVLKVGKRRFGRIAIN